MIRRPPRSTRPDTLFPYTTLFRSGTHVLSVRGTRSSYIALNNQKPPFDEVRVRHAVAHALVRQLLVDKILDGTAPLIARSEERRVGKKCVSKCRSRRSPDH